MVGGRSEVFAGGELENYLRALQATGQVALYPWSVRAFSPREVDSLVPVDEAHPWATRYDLGRRTPSRGASFDAVRPQVILIENTAFPYGDNNGPVWAGRGLTTVVQAGLAVRYGRFSATVAPMWFRAENRAFELMPNSYSGRLAFADGLNPNIIDRPQRFGAAPYTVIDPGQSTLRVDLGRWTTGISTANQTWGPGARSPLILSNNAAGLPSVFFGTTRPLDIWVGRAHGRLIYADLRQSAYSDVSGRKSRRFGAGYVVTIEPRATRGLEVGIARFFHRAWPAGGPGLRDFAWPFQAILKTWNPSYADSIDDPHFANPDNQLISAFGRWLLPKSGLELFGEFAREDNARGVRDLLVEPDHSAGYSLGFRKVRMGDRSRLWVLRGELTNMRVAALGPSGREGLFYVHSRTRQGHTFRGQILGAADGYGGATSCLGVDLYSSRGRWSLQWTRALRGIRSSVPGDDVVHSLGIDGVVFQRGLDLSVGVAVALDMNRDFRRDRFNVNAFVGVRADLGHRR